MSETKATPGEWKWDAGDIGQERSEPYCDVYTFDGGDPDETIIARVNFRRDAPLIAAAPDQNEALIALRLAADRLRAALSVAIHGGPARDLTETYAEHTAADVLALRAIAKAKGEV